jgi:diadenosine tetraphosphate (Ap4A) HIT family hydrolase
VDRCPFCMFVLSDPTRVLLAATDHVVAFEDVFPVTPGHALVIPRRHTDRVLDLTDTEYADLWSVGRHVLHQLEQHRPDAYTIAVNDGRAAGQTVPHVHLHLIPRKFGDLVVASARRGLRWVRPEDDQIAAA